MDELTDFVKKPQIGAKGLVYVKCNNDGTYKSSVDKFFDQDALKAWADKAGAEKGDLLLISKRILCSSARLFVEFLNLELCC